MDVRLENSIRRVGGGYAVCLSGEIFVHHGRSWLVGRGIMMVHRMRAFAVVSEMGRGGVSVAVAAAFVNPSVAS